MSKQSEEKLQQQFSVADLINKQVLPKTQKLKPEIEFIATSDFEYTLDSDRFASILFHLIDNAQHATEDSGKVKVSVSKQNGFGLIEVEDTGSGMTEEFVAHKLFAPFITTKGNAGMGIGAYDAKQFIESLNGKLTVTSTINVGSKFVILLPLS
jgi:signal transduction histidine kinase